MRGDTLEYNVEHAKVPPNAIIEELLRRLPGLHIEPDGTIIYNGEKIQHLLVDGEDIFGDDPTLVTRNFDANKIARIQILDRRSDKAVFTGVDDGTRVKTLNLVLKNEARDGYFGRINASGGGNSHYIATAALAGFRDKEQVTALGLSGNTGVLGFNSNTGGAPASLSFISSIPDPLGASAGDGVPRFHAVGLHYANRWNGDQDHVAVNYQYGNLWSRPITTMDNRQTLASSIYTQHQESQSINQQDQHSIRGQYDWTPSQRMGVQLNFFGRFYQYQNQYTATTTSAFNEVLSNSNFRSINDRTARHNIGFDAAYRVQIGKQLGRVFSITTGIADIDYTTNGYLYSISRFFMPNGNLNSMDTTDQRKRLADRNFFFHGGMAYTQPVFSGTNLGFSYDYSVTSDAPLQHTYEREDGKYDGLVDSLSTDLKTFATTHQGRISLQGKGRHLSFTIGVDLLYYTYRQQPLTADSIFHLHYVNWTPKILVGFDPKPTIKIDFRYFPSAVLPSAVQLASIKNNNDPLHLTLGNPDLKPVVTQVFSLGFHWLKAWMVGAALNAGFSNNSISTRTITDSFGRQFSQSVNLGGTSFESVNFSLNHTIGGIDWGLGAGHLINQTESYVNTTINRTDNYTSTAGVSASKYVADQYSIQLNAKFIYYYSRNTINTSVPVHYWAQSHSAVMSIYLLKHFEVGTSASYNWQQATSGLAGSSSVFLWNTYASRNFLQNRLVLMAMVNNILDQNSGITRNNSVNVTTETVTNILGRYWMLSVIYHFDKKFKTR